MAVKRVVAFDLGASSGRAMVGLFDGQRLTLQEGHRFDNEPVILQSRLIWDVPALYKEMLNGLRAIRARWGAADAAGIDTWGVDFGLLDSAGNLIGNPLHYRDTLTDGMMERAFTVMPKQALYDRTGLAFLQFNTLYQLYALKLARDPQLDIARTLLFTPDLLAYFLSGEMGAEYTIASTSQLIDAKTRGWSEDIISAFGLPGIFAPLQQAPGARGMLKRAVTEATGMPAMPVIAVAGHDTASAVAAVPARPGERFAYISSGTWSLVGTEEPRPCITPEGLAANLTNEGGVFGTTRLLKNVMGMWIIQELKRAWELEDDAPVPYADIVAAAQSAPPFAAFIDPDDDLFLHAGGMPERIAGYLTRTGQTPPETRGGMARCVYESLAMKYRWTLRALESATASGIDALHIVGGGAQNALLNAFTASAVGIPVYIGPIEATAMGNALMQLSALGELAGQGQMREVVRRSFDIELVAPADTRIWDDQYERFLRLVMN